MDRVIFRNFILTVSSLVALAIALPPIDENTVPALRKPSAEGCGPHSNAPVVESDAARVNISTVASIPANTSSEMENTEANVQKTVSFSPEVSDEIGGSESASSSAPRHENSTTSESASTVSAEEFSTILRANTSFEPVDELEKEFVDFFDNAIPGAERTTYWEAMRIAYLNSAEEMRKICQSVYNVWCRSTHPPIVTLQTLTYELRISVLDVGAEGAKSFWIDVLKCAVEQTDHVHVTKGRRPNSVYFVEPATIWNREEEFVLDRNFESDIDLEYDFESAIKSILEKQSNGHVDASSSRLEAVYSDVQSLGKNPKQLFAEEQPTRVSDEIPGTQARTSAPTNLLSVTGEMLKPAQSVS